MDRFGCWQTSFCSSLHSSSFNVAVIVSLQGCYELGGLEEETREDSVGIFNSFVGNFSYSAECFKYYGWNRVNEGVLVLSRDENLERSCKFAKTKSEQ